MMKILHLSDLHVEPVGKLAYARANTARRMIELTEWLAHHKDEYDAIAVSGDLSCDGNIDSYHLIDAIFRSLPKPCFMVPGNHDRRKPFLECLSHFCPNVYSPENLSFSVDLGAYRLFMLDTLQPGIHWGALPDGVLDWLEAELKTLTNLLWFSVTTHRSNPAWVIWMNRSVTETASLRFSRASRTYVSVQAIYTAPWQHLPKQSCRCHSTVRFFANAA